MSKIRETLSRWEGKYYKQKIQKTAKCCGANLYCGGKSFVTSNTEIGNNFHSGPGCQIISSFHNYDTDDAIPYGNQYIHKDVTIGDNVWLGNNVIILGGVEIGEGAIIQAGSVVCKNIPAYAIAGGHPAVPFKTRDIEHYEKLKKEKKFH